MRHIEKLVRDIREGLADGSDPVSLQLLATQYAQFCHQANLRLTQCAEMIGHGNEYHALQLAGTPPSLLDLVSLLSFDRSAQWVDFCKQRSLPVPEKLDQKAVQLLNGIYSKGITGNHALYTDYRTAVVEHDDAKALTVLRNIAQLNASDTSAPKEIARIERKILQARLAEVKALVEIGDIGRLLPIIAEIEDLSRENPPEGEVWRGALELRRRHFRGQAEAEAGALVTRIAEAQQSDQWGPALIMIAQARALGFEYSFELAAPLARAVTEAQAWAEKMRSEQEREVAFHGALSTLEHQVQIARDKGIGSRTIKISELLDDKIQIDRKWEDLAKFRREIPADTTSRSQRCMRAIDAEIARLQRSRTVQWAVGAGAIFLVALVAGGFTLRYWQARELATELNGAIQSGKAGAVEKFVTDIRKDKGWLLGNATLQAALTQADGWVGGQKEKASKLAEMVGQLTTQAEDGFAGLTPVTIQQQIAQAKEYLGSVAEDLRTQGEADLLIVENKFEEFLGKTGGPQRMQFTALLKKMEAAVQSGLNFTKAPGAVRATLAELALIQAELEGLANSPVAALKPLDSELAKLDLLKGRVKKFADEIAKVDAIEQESATATGLDQYLQAVEKFLTITFVQSDEMRSARSIRGTAKDLDAFTAAMLMPGDPAAWAYFKANRHRTTFLPSSVTENEKTTYLTLRDDDYLRDIHRYELFDPNNNLGAPTIYSQAKLTKTEPIPGEVMNLSGRVYIPWKSKNLVNFKTETFKAQILKGQRSGSIPEKEQLTPESDFVAKLGLSSLVDGSVSSYRRPVFPLLDAVVSAKQLNPLFKAYLQSKLVDLAGSRPFEWGLHWTSVRQDQERLAAIAGNSLASSDWMSPARNSDLATQLARFYLEMTDTSYATQAAVLQPIVEKAYTTGFSYAGFVRTDGQPHLISEGVTAQELWGLADGEPKPALLYRRPSNEAAAAWEKVTPAHLLTPLFICSLDRQKTLQQACLAVKVAPQNPSLTSILPPFFAAGYETKPSKEESPPTSPAPRRSSADPNPVPASNLKPL